MPRQQRLNKFVHNIMFLNDEDTKSEWISSTLPNNVTITVDLIETYLIHKIEIIFSSLPSTNLVMQRFHQDKWHLVQNYSTPTNRRLSNQNLTLVSWHTDLNQKYTNNSNNISTIGFEIENLKASKLQFKLNGFFSDLKSDLRKLYYAIAEIRVMAM